MHVAHTLLVGGLHRACQEGYLPESRCGHSPRSGPPPHPALPWATHRGTQSSFVPASCGWICCTGRWSLYCSLAGSRGASSGRGPQGPGAAATTSAPAGMAPFSIAALRRSTAVLRVAALKATCSGEKLLALAVPLAAAAFRAAASEAVPLVAPSCATGTVIADGTGWETLQTSAYPWERSSGRRGHGHNGLIGAGCRYIWLASGIFRGPLRMEAGSGLSGGRHQDRQPSTLSKGHASGAMTSARGTAPLHPTTPPDCPINTYIARRACKRNRRQAGTPLPSPCSASSPTPGVPRVLYMPSKTARIFFSVPTEGEAAELLCCFLRGQLQGGLACAGPSDVTSWSDAIISPMRPDPRPALHASGHQATPDCRRRRCCHACCLQVHNCQLLPWWTTPARARALQQHASRSQRCTRSGACPRTCPPARRGPSRLARPRRRGAAPL